MLPSMIWVAKNLYFFNCLLDGAHTTGIYGGFGVDGILYAECIYDLRE